MAEKLPRALENVLYGREHGFSDDPVWQAMQFAVCCGVADDFVLGSMDQRVHQHQVRRAMDGPFSGRQHNQGDFVLGLDIHKRPVLCPHEYFNEPSLTIGSTGSGKTTKSRFWTLQLASKVEGLWLIDLRKREYRILRPYLQRVGVDLLIVPARKLRLNPLQVPD